MLKEYLEVVHFLRSNYKINHLPRSIFEVHLPELKETPKKPAQFLARVGRDSRARSYPKAMNKCSIRKYCIFSMQERTKLKTRRLRNLHTIVKIRSLRCIVSVRSGSHRSWRRWNVGIGRIKRRGTLNFNRVSVLANCHTRQRIHLVR